MKSNHWAGETAKRAEHILCMQKDCVHNPLCSWFPQHPQKQLPELPVGNSLSNAGCDLGKQTNNKVQPPKLLQCSFLVLVCK